MMTKAKCFMIPFSSFKLMIKTKQSDCDLVKDISQLSAISLLIRFLRFLIKTEKKKKTLRVSSERASSERKEYTLYGY